MKTLAALAASLMLASLAACGPPSAPQTAESAKEAPSAEPAASAAPAPSAEPSSAPEAGKAAPSSDSPAETLARDLIKAGGRRIGFSAGKKRFVVPIETRGENTRGLSLRFFDDEGQEREVLKVCQPGECEERLNELAKDLLPKLVERIEKEGYEAVSSIGWPSGREEIDVSSAGLKLRYEKGKLSVVREKKPATPLRSLGGRTPKAASLSAVYLVPAGKLLGAFAEGDKVVQEFYVFKLP